MYLVGWMMNNPEMRQKAGAKMSEGTGAYGMCPGDSAAGDVQRAAWPLPLDGQVLLLLLSCPHGHCLPFGENDLELKAPSQSHYSAEPVRGYLFYPLPLPGVP